MKKSLLLLGLISSLCLLSACGGGGGAGGSNPPPAAAIHFSVAPATSTSTAGTAFIFTVTALDTSNNLVAKYSGLVQFSTTDSQAALPANSTLTNGTLQFQVTLKTAGVQTITATDSARASITGTSNPINVAAAAPSRLSLVAPPAATAYTTFTLTVTAVDAFKNTAASYAGTVQFKSSDPQAVALANSTLTNGVGNFLTKLVTVGSQTITATDTVTASITGSSNPINVTAAGALAITSGTPPGGTVGERYDVHCNQIPPCNLIILGFPLTATGGVPPYAWSWAGSTPPGLYIAENFRCPNLRDGICGTPAAAGVYQVVVTLTDSGSPSAKKSANYTINVRPAAGPSSEALNNPAMRHEHHHYKFVELGTFGGPQSLISGEPSYNVVNSAGTLVGGADTSIPTPEPACYNPTLPQDCFISHAFVWRGESLKDLGTLPGGNFSFAAAINQREQIAGVSENNQVDPAFGNPEFHAVLWENDQILDLGTLGGTVSFAAMVNDRGQVIGEALNDVPDPLSILGLGGGLTLTQTRAFLWQHGKMHDLGTLGGPDSWAMFVNDRGQVAGASYTNDVDPKTGTPQIDAFLWENGKMKDLGNLGGTNWLLGAPSLVNALNNRGQVVGIMALPGDQVSHPFLWDGEKLSDLGNFGGAYSAAWGINDAGDIAGYSDFSGDQVKHAFWWRNGVMTDLGTVGADPCSFAYTINAKGQIGGGSQTSDGAGGCVDSYVHAVLWENGEPGVDLNTLISADTNLQLTVVYWINDGGEIAGRGHDPACPNGDSCDAHAFVLIPCDENHPDIEGCDYNPVDVVNAAQVPSVQITQSPATTPANLSPVELMARIRISRAGRNRHFGMPQVSPK